MCSNVSEQGLRFRATAPLEPIGPIHFSFSAHSDVVEGIADLVWTDPAKKTGGLRFTQLSDSARDAIRNWPHQSDLQLSVGQDFMLHMPPSDESSRAGARGLGVFDAALQFASSWSKRFGSTLRECLHLGQKEGQAALDALQLEDRFKERKRSLFIALSITVVIILLSTLSLVSYVRHRELGEWLVRVGTRMSGEGQLQAVTQASPSTLSIQPLGAGGVSTDQSKVVGTQEQAALQPTDAATPTIPKETTSAPSLREARTTNFHPPTHATPGKELVVQVAALKQEAEARELADSLRHKNFQAFVRTLPADPLYRVLLGPYANTTAARTAVDQLKKAGIHSFIRREPAAVLSGSLRMPTP